MPDRQHDNRGQGQGSAGKNDGGVGMASPENHGRSEWSPGHRKGEAGAGSARDVAPGHGGEPPGHQGHGRDSTENATETPELDSFDREG